MATKLQSSALIWWQQYQQSRERRGLRRITTWTEMKDKLDEKYLPFDYYTTLYRKFHHLRQKVEQNVASYTEEFYKYLSRLNLNETDDQLVARYLSGLKISIYDELILHRINNLEEAFQMSLRAKEKLTRAFKKKERIFQKDKNIASRSEFSKPLAHDKTNDHRTIQNNKGGTKTCFRCHKTGHLAYQCPEREKQNRLNLINEEEIDEESDGEAEIESADEAVEENCDPDSGAESLVIRRVLTAPKVKESNNWLRGNIFHTFCTAYNKKCLLLIDSGSCENMVSKKMIDKLNLKCERHPRPYKISWFKKGGEVPINERCLIKFSIGKYSDEVWCDVLPMDACHILLGRPWQYDRSVQHDGRNNTYSLIFNEIKFI